MLQSSDVGSDRLREAVLSPWVAPTTASIGRNGKNKPGLAVNGIQEYDFNEGDQGLPLSVLAPFVSNYRPPRATNSRPHSIYGTRCFTAYTIIFLGKHILRCVFTSTLFDIPWLVPHDVFAWTLGFTVDRS